MTAETLGWAVFFAIVALVAFGLAVEAGQALARWFRPKGRRIKWEGEP